MTKTAKTATNEIALDYPLQRGETPITTITLRRPSSGSLRGLSLTDLLSMNTDALTKVIPRISTPSLTEQEVGMLDPSDLVAIGSEIAGFLVPKRLKETTE